MHARLKKLEPNADMEWGTRRGSLGRAASLGSAHRQQTHSLAAHSAPPVEGPHLDLQKAQGHLQVWLHMDTAIMRSSVKQHTGKLLSKSQL